MDRHANTRRERNGRKKEEREGEYKRTCHVYGQTRQYERGTEREGDRKRNKKKRGREVRVHLSRLWTDTQVRGERKGGGGDWVAQLSKGEKIFGENWTSVVQRW